MYGQQFLVKSTHRNPIRKMSLFLQEKRRNKSICQSQDKREGGKGIAAIRKASLHLTIHISCPCVPPGAQPYMPAAATLLRFLRKHCVPKRGVVLVSLFNLQNQKQWRFLLLSSSRLSFRRRPNGALRARLSLPSRWPSPWLSVLAPTLMSLFKLRYDFLNTRFIVLHHLPCMYASYYYFYWFAEAYLHSWKWCSVMVLSNYTYRFDYVTWKFIIKVKLLTVLIASSLIMQIH